MCSQKFHKIHRKTPVPESLFIKVACQDLQLLLKKTLAQVFSSEFCEIFKNTFFYRTLPVASSGFTVKVFEKYLRQSRTFSSLQPATLMKQFPQGIPHNSGKIFCRIFCCDCFCYFYQYGDFPIRYYVSQQQIRRFLKIIT